MKKILAVSLMVMMVSPLWVTSSYAASDSWAADGSNNWSVDAAWVGANAAVVGVAAGDTIGLTFDIAAAKAVPLTS